MEILVGSKLGLVLDLVHFQPYITYACNCTSKVKSTLGNRVEQEICLIAMYAGDYETWSFFVRFSNPLAQMESKFIRN